MDTAQAGLSMPRHVPGQADYDIWVAQKPPMLIDRLATLTNPCRGPSFSGTFSMFTLLVATFFHRLEALSTTGQGKHVPVYREASFLGSFLRSVSFLTGAVKFLTDEELWIFGKIEGNFRNPWFLGR